MARDLPIDRAQGLVILRWRASGDGLFLTARGHAEEMRLQSRCGRCHWIVHEHLEGSSPQLLVRCHSCHEQISLALEEPGGNAG